MEITELRFVTQIGKLHELCVSLDTRDLYSKQGRRYRVFNKKKGEELNNPRKGNQISIYPETRVYFFARETFSSGIYEVTRVSANFEIQIHF